MSDTMRVTLDPGFEVTIPMEWTAEADEEGGVRIAAGDGPGLLHLIAFPQPVDELLDPAEELYVFLEDQGIELEEDEVEDMTLAEGQDLSLCEYMAEYDEEADPEAVTYWMVGVATGPGNLVFCSYSCAAGAEEEERATIRDILASLRLKG